MNGEHDAQQPPSRSLPDGRLQIYFRPPPGAGIGDVADYVAELPNGMLKLPSGDGCREVRIENARNDLPGYASLIVPEGVDESRLRTVLTDRLAGW